ncbi:MAG: hypothetical protein HY308_03135 [Gammaproteobacteria bacterium]|nr:hypothetical protein [Gammaproteobacteria bacterium]
MRKLGVWTRIEPRLVQGENIAQTFQFISTGNASLGFVALERFCDRRRRKRLLRSWGIWHRSSPSLAVPLRAYA